MHAWVVSKAGSLIWYSGYLLVSRIADRYLPSICMMASSVAVDIMRQKWRQESGRLRKTSRIHTTVYMDRAASTVADQTHCTKPCMHGHRRAPYCMPNLMLHLINCMHIIRHDSQYNYTNVYRMQSPLYDDYHTCMHTYAPGPGPQYV